MKFPRSIRWRIQVWHGALLSAVIAGFCVMTYGLEKTNLYRMMDTELSLRLDTLIGNLGARGLGGPGDNRPRPPAGMPPFGGRGQMPGRPGAGPGVGPGAFPGPGPEGNPPPPGPDDLPPSDITSLQDRERQPPPDGFRLQNDTGLFVVTSDWPFYYCLWTRVGHPFGKSDYLPDGIAQPEKNAASGMKRVPRIRGEFRELYSYTPPGECILVGRSMKPVEAELHRFATNLALAGLGVLIFGLAGGWWVASIAIRPIRAISTAAARISGGNLAERIDLADTRSELGQLAAVLNDAFQRLDAAFSQQARFTSDAAHELRTPVAVILGQTQLALSRSRTEAEYRETLEACQRAAKRMHGLIESLLELSVLDATGTKLKRQPCDLAMIGRENLEMIQLLADERQIVLKGDLAPAPCSADADRISQILVNLLSNAVKFSGPGTIVRLVTSRDNGGAVIRIEDTGPGIPAEHLEHLFDRFYRVDKSRNRASGGAGLGLAISKSIAEAHGGAISVESAVGKGTAFTLRIPAVP